MPIHEMNNIAWSNRALGLTVTQISAREIEDGKERFTIEFGPP